MVLLFPFVRFVRFVVNFPGNALKTVRVPPLPLFADVVDPFCRRPGEESTVILLGQTVPTTYSYDENGNELSTTDQLGDETVGHWDGPGQFAGGEPQHGGHEGRTRSSPSSNQLTTDNGQRFGFVFLNPSTLSSAHLSAFTDLIPISNPSYANPAT
jgi:hypothetical protein